MFFKSSLKWNCLPTFQVYITVSVQSVDPCLRLECGPWAQCEAAGSGAACVCLPCPAADASGPVCGSDGRDYDSECQLRATACRHGLEDLALRHRGRCNACLDHKCPPYAICFTDLHGNPHCRCSNICADLPESLVCGSDGVTYRTDCDLKMASCENKVHIIVAHRGPCDACRGVVCEEPAAVCRGGLCTCRRSCPRAARQRRLCGSDGRSYDSECHLQLASCRRPRGRPPIAVAYQGECRDTSADMGRHTPSASPPACQTSPFGCCPDGETPAGSNGCTPPAAEDDSDECGCNRIGSLPGSCAAQGGCSCRPGVGGERCDRCLPGYWGLAAIPQGHRGCLPCNCSALGSVREDCEQTTGRCACRAGVQGRKCAACAEPGRLLTRAGCLAESEIVTSTPSEGDWTTPSGEPLWALAQTTHQLPSPATQHQLPRTAADDRITSASLQHDLSGDAYQVPAFDGESYIQLKCLKAYNKLNIEMEFISYANDGLLLYNQQKEDGTGDFVSLAIVEGFIEFRYDLGSGAAVLTSAGRITLGRAHQVSARRYHRDGLLRLDAGPEVAGQAPGALRALDLHMDAFVGALPANLTRVPESVGAARGLVGCVRQLRLNQEAVRLHEGEPQVVRAAGVRDCADSPCQALPCRHAGSCAPAGPHSFRCLCPPEFTGAYCETRVSPCVSSPCVAGTVCEVILGGGFTCRCASSNNSLACQYSDAGNQEAFVPEFNGSSYIELPRLEGVARAFALEIWFLTNTNDGILLYNSQQLDGKGDYIAIVLISGHIQFHFNLGSGPANIRTPNRVTLGKWHSVKVSRVDREGTLQLDDGPIARGTSGPPLMELNVELPLYIGGLPRAMNSGIIPVPNLSGAVQRFVINGEILEDLGDKAETVSRWRGPPCSSYSCLNGGTCRPRLNSFVCHCPENFTGRYCQHIDVAGNEETKPVKFNGKTYVRLSVDLDARLNSSVIMDGINESWHYDTNDGIIQKTFPTGAKRVKEYNHNDRRHGVSMLEYNESDNFMSGEKLEKNLSSTDISHENGLHEFTATSRSGRKHRTIHHYEITFHTMENNGILLWCSKSIRHRSNYVAIAIVDGHLQLRSKRDKNKSVSVLNSKVFVSDGRLHTVVAQQHWITFLQVDEEQPAWDVLVGRSVETHSRRTLWLGGTHTLPTGLPGAYYAGFRGCIHRVVILKQLLDIQKVWDSSQSLLHCHEQISV